jgi:hypothetical protein
VAKEVAAQVLGLAVGTLANRRAEGSAPPHYRIGKVIYLIIDLANWIESSRNA